MSDAKPKIEIRLALPNDATAISTILSEAFAEYEPLYTKEGYIATTPKSDVIKNRFGEGKIWVAVLIKKIVGTISIVSKDDALYIRSMAILPTARGNRIGEKLLKEIENFAIANDFRRLSLSTTPFLHRAIWLYEKFGFERKGVDDLFGTPLIKIEKKLL